MTTKQVHIYGPSFSNFVQTVMLACEENDINYTTGFEIDGKDIVFKSEQHFSLHPFGKLPVLLEGDFACICDNESYFNPFRGQDFHQTLSVDGTGGTRYAYDNFAHVCSLRFFLLATCLEMVRICESYFSIERTTMVFSTDFHPLCSAVRTELLHG